MVTVPPAGYGPGRARAAKHPEDADERATIHRGRSSCRAPAAFLELPREHRAVTPPRRRLSGDPPSRTISRLPLVSTRASVSCRVPSVLLLQTVNSVCWAPH